MKNKRFIGLDLSLTSSGVCIIDESYNVIYSARIKTSKKRGMERLEYILEKVKESIKNIDAIAIENYSFGVRNSSSLTGLGELGGVIKLMLYKKGKDYVLASPGQVKKYATGKGNAKKSLMLMKVFKKYHEEFTNSDECDAYVLARIARDVFSEDNNSLLEYEKEVIDKLKKRGKEW